jgi:peroxiredoxin
MKRLAIGDFAPDFTLPDHTGEFVKFSDVCRQKNVLLVFNFGFVCPHCKNHMMQLHHDYQKIQAMDAEVLVVVPNGPKTISDYRRNTGTPYPILSDKGSRVAGQYSQIKQVLSVGTPTVFVVDHSGQIRYAYYATSMIEEPDNSAPLSILAEIAG